MLLLNVRVAGALVDIRADGGVITEIGERLRGDAAESIDCDGRFASPGLWHNHVHFSQWAMQSQRLDLSEVGLRRACNLSRDG